MRNCAGRGAFFRAARAYFINHRAFFELSTAPRRAAPAHSARASYVRSCKYRDKVIGTRQYWHTSIDAVADTGKRCPFSLFGCRYSGIDLKNRDPSRVLRIQVTPAGSRLMFHLSYAWLIRGFYSRLGNFVFYFCILLMMHSHRENEAQLTQRLIRSHLWHFSSTDSQRERERERDYELLKLLLLTS